MSKLDYNRGSKIRSDCSLCETPTPTPTHTTTVSITPSKTITATPTVTPSITVTTSITPSITPSISITPSNNSNPTPTPTRTTTPTPSIDNSSSPHLFNKSSWNGIIPEPFKTYFDQAADRWNTYIKYNPQVRSGIPNLYAGWNGLALRTGGYTEINDSTSNTIASCGPYNIVDINGGKAIWINSVNFHVTINKHWQTTFNSSDWVNIITHELGHALGVGIFWQSELVPYGAVPPVDFFLDGSVYTDSQIGYNSISQSNKTKIPLENSGGTGTASAHWENNFRPSTAAGANGVSYAGLGNELMIGSISPGSARILSLLSIKNLVDYGYQEVNPGSSEGPVTLVSSIISSIQGTTISIGCNVEGYRNNLTTVGTIYLPIDQQQVNILNAKPNAIQTKPKVVKTYNNLLKSDCSTCVTPTPTPTISLSPTRTASLTPTQTKSLTPSITTTKTPTVTPTITPSVTATVTPSISVTVTPTISVTVSSTPSNTPTITPTRTVTLSSTQRPTATPTRTPSATPTHTRTPTVTSSITPTPTVTSSITPTPTITPSTTPPTCCNWDGNGFLILYGCNLAPIPLHFTELNYHYWETSGYLPCGDYFVMSIICHDDVDPTLCGSKWEAGIYLPCALVESISVDNSCTCDHPPTWTIHGNFYSCQCCQPPPTASLQTFPILSS